MLDFANLFGKINEAKTRMNQVRDQLDNITVEAEAGGGMVRVSATANRKILKIAIDPTIIDKDDPELLGDLVTAAVNKALDKAAARGQEEIEKVTKDIMPNIPGMDLSKLGL